MFNLLRDKTVGLTPFSFTVISGWVIFGLLLMGSSVVAGWDASPAIDANPWPVQFGIGLFIAVGGVMTMAAERNWDNLNTGWILEKVGNILAFGGWIAYAATAWVQDWRHTGVIFFGLVMATAVLARFSHTYAYERFVKTRVKKLWASGYPRNR